MLPTNIFVCIKFQVLTAMVEKLRNYDDDPLPQDLQEGVDDDEWVWQKSFHQILFLMSSILRLFLSIALRIPTVHDFRVVSACMCQT